ncbi:uncharacterized protein [Tursiops truncatus]|uniref:Ethylene-responsive transcription factor ABI4-like isoform X1 n=1 Tax=Tursiops truncatus TaxID=9739 RepID=A0A6J3S3I6_TURTR|nr:ethylene-responsive transcription factor ABI4-like isoform X1 [Tursiops truncatus]
MRGSPSRVFPAGPPRLRTRRSPCSVGGFPGVARAPSSLLPGLRAARRPSRGRPPARPSVSNRGSSLPCSEVRDLPELGGRGGWRRSCLTAGRGGPRPRGARPAARGRGRAEPRLRPRERNPRTRRGQKLFGGASIKAEGAAASLPLPPDTPRRQLTHLNPSILNLSVAPGSLPAVPRPSPPPSHAVLQSPPQRPAPKPHSLLLVDPRHTLPESTRSCAPLPHPRSVVLQAAAAPWGPNTQSWVSTTPHPSPAVDPQPPARRFRSRLHAEYPAPTDGPTGRLRHTHPLTRSETEFIIVFLKTGLVQTSPH